MPCQISLIDETIWLSLNVLALPEPLLTRARQGNLVYGCSEKSAAMPAVLCRALNRVDSTQRTMRRAANFPGHDSLL